MLKDPLPQGYPLKGLSGYRSYLSYGFGPNTRTSYPYKFNIKDQGYELDNTFDFTWSRSVKWDDLQRTFFGFHISFQSAKSEFGFSNGTATETYSLLSVGPRLERDVWVYEKFRINLSTSLLISIIDEVRIKINSKEAGLAGDDRSFSSFQVMPTFGANIQRKKAIRNVDLIAGVNVFFHLPHSYSALDKSEEPSWWNNSKYENPFYANISFFLGFQTTL